MFIVYLLIYFKFEAHVLSTRKEHKQITEIEIDEKSAKLRLFHLVIYIKLKLSPCVCVCVCSCFFLHECFILMGFYF